MDPRVSEAAQIALFAPYCGGLARQAELKGALRILEAGSLEGTRPVQGTSGHAFQLTWSGGQAPLEIVACQLLFPGHGWLTYRFEAVTHQLVMWLMDVPSEEAPEGCDLPDGFWQWLLVGGDEDNDA